MLKNADPRPGIPTNRPPFTDVGIVALTALNLMLPVIGIAISETFEFRVVDPQSYTETQFSRLFAQGFAYILLGSIVLNSLIFLILRLARRSPSPVLVLAAEAGLTVAAGCWTLGLSLDFTDFQLLSLLLVWGGGAFAASTSTLALVLAAIPSTWAAKK